MLDRAMRLSITHAHAPKLDVDLTVGDLIDGIKQAVIDDIKSDPEIALAIAKHLEVRPT